MENVNNPLFVLQLHAFISLAKATTSFLTRYQTDSPMLPFVKSDLKDLLKDLLKRFVKKEVLEGANTVMKSLRIDPCDRGKHGPSSAIDIGFAAEQTLRRLKAAKKVTEKD